VAEVIAELQGVARTGPGTNYARLTPLPKGTKAAINGSAGDWLRLDYGGLA
jgi:N-acetylmuramoyl-L-alanine amidase